jgi:hypothetical protein
MSLRLAETDWNDADSIVLFVAAIDREVRLRTKMPYLPEPENVAFTPPAITGKDQIPLRLIYISAIDHLSGIFEKHFSLLTGDLYDTIVGGIDRMQYAAYRADLEIGNDQ